MNTLLSQAEMEKACRHRDATYDGLFVFAVRTTGIFCRPACPARQPMSKNVEFFSTAQAALKAGYRPCKRCRPLHLDQQPAWATQLIARLQNEPSSRITEEDLRTLGIDPATVRRYFLRHYGMTFHAFQRAVRLGRALNQLQNGEELDAAVFDSGYASHSGFREAFVRQFGKTPGHCSDRRCVLVTWIQSPLGPLLAASTDDGICLLEFVDVQQLDKQRNSLSKLFKRSVVPGSNAHLQQLQNELAAYFDGSARQFSVPLDMQGTSFQQRVWAQLLTIPYGETRTYEEMAVAIGKPTAIRAVGRANGANRIAIVVPCHRVVNKSGKLGGYAGGLRRKQHLLHLERSVVDLEKAE